MLVVFTVCGPAATLPVVKRQTLWSATGRPFDPRLFWPQLAVHTTARPRRSWHAVAADANHLLRAPQRTQAQALNPAPIPAIPEQRGSYEMELQFNEECSSTKAANWTYSSSLQQVFVNMGHICPITIRTAKPIPETSLLRMYLKYQKDRDKDPVTRCPTHVADPEAKSDDAPPEHVLRSNNPNAQYRTDSRGVHCIILPTALTRGELTLQQTELIRIMCFSSCAGGIARRPLELIFEVSDGGQLLCRQSLAVRVCACPGRDRRNLEKSAAADVLSLLGKGDTGTSRSGKVKRAGVNKKKPLSLTRTVTAINMRGPQDDNDRTRYTINVVGHDNFLMAEKIAKALHDAQGDAVLPSTAPSEKQLQAITGVPGWLALWSLEKHADGFLAQGYDDIELLEHMDAKDIANVGIKSKADKQRFQEAVAHLVTVVSSRATCPALPCCPSTPRPRRAAGFSSSSMPMRSFLCGPS